jgi:hypothetical protein
MLREKASLNEGHGFSRAVNLYSLDGFSRWGTLFETHRAKSSLYVCEFAADGSTRVTTRDDRRNAHHAKTSSGNCSLIHTVSVTLRLSPSLLARAGLRYRSHKHAQPSDNTPIWS